jgi:hypothetical protein
MIDHCWDCGLAQADLRFAEDLAPWPQQLCADCRSNRSSYETEPEERACAIGGRQPINRAGHLVSVCSRACERERHKRRRRLLDHGWRVCAAPGCEDKFYAIRSDQLFCSPACQKRSRRQRGPVRQHQSLTYSADEPF